MCLLLETLVLPLVYDSMVSTSTSVNNKASLLPSSEPLSWRGPEQLDVRTDLASKTQFITRLEQQILLSLKTGIPVDPQVGFP